MISEWVWLGLSVCVFGILYGWTKRAPKASSRRRTGKSSAPPPNGALEDAIDSQRTGLPKSLPNMKFEEEEESAEPTRVGAQTPARVMSAKKIVYDEDAVTDEPTHGGALILLTATAQTDAGLKRARNEDSLLVNEEHGLFVVADGMGGYAGGEIASKLAVTTISTAFNEQNFVGVAPDGLPKRATELALSIQMANEAIRKRVETDKHLKGMGTTIVAARFSPQKQRLYVGHVGDSRMYRLRNGELVQVTSDHTMQQELGVQGDASSHLSRAVGVWATVSVDVIVAKPDPGDVYLLCSDGLTKMVSDEDIRTTLMGDSEPARLVEVLIEKANANGGKDNVTVIVIRVANPLAIGTAKSGATGAAHA